MVQVQLLLKMAIDIKVHFIMGCSMDKVNLHGLMVLFIKDNLLIIESRVKEYINGQMEVFIKVKSKMD